MGESGGVSNNERKVNKNRRMGEKHPGEVSLVKLSKEELDDFIDYMTLVYNGTYLNYLYSIIGPEKILLYLETLEDMTVRIPTKKTLVKVIFYVRVYNYLKVRNFTDEAFVNASKIFKKRVFDLRRIVGKVQRVLERCNEEV